MHVVPESDLNLLLAHLPPEVTWEEFRSVRNGIVTALAAFGSIGPSGMHDDNDQEFSVIGELNCDFFVVDDMYNDEQRLHLIETGTALITEPVLNALSCAVSREPHWAAHVALGDAGLCVFTDRIVACGRRFWDCNSVGDIVKRCSVPVDFGEAPAPWADGYAIWHDLVCGEWQRTDLPTAPDRQWTYILGYLSHTKRISQFTYRGRVVHELHPATRLEFVSRFLDGYQEGREISAVGLETVTEDSGKLLALLDDATAEKLLIQLAAAQARLAGNAAFHFWSRVVGSAEKGRTASILASFLLTKMTPPTPAIASLAALLGLACLKHPAVAEQAARLRREGGDWSESVCAWLLKLSTELNPYPYPRDDLDLSSLHRGLS